MESLFHPPFAIIHSTPLDGNHNGDCGIAKRHSLVPLTSSNLIQPPSTSPTSSRDVVKPMMIRQATATTEARSPPSPSPPLNLPMSFNDAFRWNSHTSENYISNNGVAMISSFSRFSATNNNNNGGNICDLDDSSVRYGIEGDTRIHRNNKYNTNSHDWKFHSGNNGRTDESHGTATMRTVINYWLRSISSGLITSMEMVIKTNKCPRRCTSWKSIISIVIYTLLMTTITRHCDAHKHEVTNCTFPQRWEGSWFLSGNQQPVSIKGSTLSFRGKCVASDGDKFLVVDEKGCHRCLVIYEKHKNVLQYKESECEGDNLYMMDQSNPAAMSIQQIRSSKSDHMGGVHPNSRPQSSSDQFARSNDDNNYYCKGRESLQSLCEQIAGDALLYSLFKENAEPVKCPLRGPFTFTYNRGHGECKNPVSNIESCTEDSRLLLNLQACPDVAGTESTVEELTCLATWKDGNSRYLVGLVSHHHAISNEERYRCFVYERISPIGGNSKDAEYKLAQSGDATCNGLDSAEVGSRIMTLRKAPPSERCDFPTWVKGPKHWHALAGNVGYIFHASDGSMHITKQNGFMETRALCEQINKQTTTEMQAIVHYTTGCQSGFMCMMFYRRDTHVAEIQMGTPAARLEDACAPDYFDVNKLSFVTLLASNIDAQECPVEGLYSLRDAIGPPYITSRHKRNHNKGYHRHHTDHKRFSTLSFRNPEEFSGNTWQTRGIPIRNRRDANMEIARTDIESLNNFMLVRQRRSSNALNVKETGLSIAPLSTQPRDKRDAPECVANYRSQRHMLIGCSKTNVIEVRPKCIDVEDEVYNCHGSWTENATIYMVAKHAGSQHGVCITYRPLEGNSIQIVIGDSCHRGHLPIPDHHLTTNVTLLGKCSDTSSSNPLTNNWILICIMTYVTVVTLTLNR